MENEPILIGRKYSEEEIQAMKEGMAEKVEEWFSPIEGEKEKTMQELEITKTVSELIEEELQRLGIDSEYKLVPDQIHFLDMRTYRSHFPDMVDAGCYAFTQGEAVYIDKTMYDREPTGLVMVLLHESIHLFSKRTYYATEGLESIHNARTGFSVQSPWKEPEGISRLNGFNEIVVDSTIRRISLRNINKLEPLGITKEQLERHHYSYADYGKLFNVIIKKVANYHNRSTAEQFEVFEKGQFDENLLALKDIDKVFGYGALDILSYLNMFDGKDGKKIDLLVQAYFESNSVEERAEIISQIGLLTAHIRNEKPPESEISFGLNQRSL